MFVRRSVHAGPEFFRLVLLGSRANRTRHLAETGFSRMTALYFSFVTLATLRYGDIVPNERGPGFCHR